MPIAVRIAHTVRIVSKTLTPQDKGYGEMGGVVKVAGWWSLEVRKLCADGTGVMADDGDGDGDFRKRSHEFATRRRLAASNSG
jgi:hypothetical protein